MKIKKINKAKLNDLVRTLGSSLIEKPKYYDTDTKRERFTGQYFVNSLDVRVDKIDTSFKNLWFNELERSPEKEYVEFYTRNEALEYIKDILLQDLELWADVVYEELDSGDYNLITIKDILYIYNYLEIIWKE